MIRTVFIFLLAFNGILGAFAQNPDTLNLMPRPQAVKIQSGRFTFTGKFTIGINGPESARMVAAVNRFYLQLGKRTGIYFQQENITAKDNQPDALLSVNYQMSIVPAIGIDESYRLNVSADKITLSAATDIGAERGLETLYQLVSSDRNTYYCPQVKISDFPRFKWRGLMIDVARHFIPFEVLKRNIDAMATVKMNVLHLHLSDDEGFRVESFVYPLLQQKGSNGLYYTQNQVKELVNYAHERGIIIVPEFDLPGHCSSILAAYPFLASYPSDYKPSKRYKLDTIKNLSLGKVMQMISQMPTPTIDPAKESTYTFFDRFFKEMSSLFPDAYLHIGADENNGVAWKQNPAIVAFMKTKGMQSTDDLQAYFVKRMYLIAKKYNKRLIGWEEAFNPSLPEDVIVQKWKPAVVDTLSNKVISHHNQLIISAGYYLDLFLPAYIHYLNDPVSATLSQAEADKGILGAEAAIWSEVENEGNEEIRVWPRTAAIAERLWSASNVRDVDDMYRRLWQADVELNDNGLDEYANYNRIIQGWANTAGITPVKTIVDVCTPVKGYKRLMGLMLAGGDNLPNLTSPMVKIADAAHCDSETGWDFRRLVAAYLANHNPSDLERIKEQLTAWQNNSIKFNALALNSPYLQQITDLSDRLSQSASIALQFLNGQGDSNARLQQLQQMEVPAHEVQLAIIPALEAIITGKLKDEPASYPLF